MTNLERFARFRWEDTELGPVAGWPPVMRAFVQTVLASGMPLATAWGRHRVQIYNDAYNAIYAGKHPEAFGAPAETCWAEIWPFLGPAIDTIFDEGRTLNFSRSLLAIRKHDIAEECYFDFSYSPIYGDAGEVLGFLSTAVETTEQTVSERRQRVLDRIASIRLGPEGVPALWQGLHDALLDNADDAAAAVLFAVDPLSGLPECPIWRLRTNATLDAQLYRMACDRHRPGPMQAPSIHHWDTPANSAGLRALCLIPVLHEDDSPAALLALVPGPLVPPARSLLPFAGLLGQRLHDTLHEQEAQARRLRSVSAELKDTEELYRFLFDNMLDGALYAVTHGEAQETEIVLAANRQTCALLGYSEQEIVGKSREQLVFDDGDLLRAAVAQRERSNVFVGELNFRHRDGHPIPVEVSSHLVRTAAGDTRSVTLVRDARARREQERRHLDEVRTDTIAQLSAGIAHDFNNLLTVMLGGLDLLRDELTPGSTGAEVAATMQQAADKASMLTREILAFSGARSGEARPVDVAAQVMEMAQILRSTVGDSIRLELELASDLPHCRLDPVLLSSALLNLVLNARDAMPDGGTATVRVDLPADAGADQPPQVRLEVSDTGTGIAPTLIDRIFDPFFTTKASGQGTGLGLPMVQAFAQRSGGQVRVRNLAPRGAAFELRFPVADGVDEARPAIDTAPPGRAQGQTVLIVDDNPLVREQARRILSDAGFACLCARDGPAALALLVQAGQQIDILFSDIAMPGGLSGRALADEARRLVPGLPVLLTSGYDAGEPGAGDREEAYRILPKPYTRDAVLRALLDELARAADC